MGSSSGALQRAAPHVHVCVGVCASVQGPRCALQTRVLFHCAHKLGDEAKLMQYHQQLTDSIEDQLSLASIHYHRR